MLFALLITLRHLSRYQRNVLFMAMMLVLASCNEQQFYQKDFLEGAGVEKPTIPSVPSTPATGSPSTPTNGGSTSDPSAPTNGGGTSDPTPPTTGGGVTTDPTNGGGTTDPSTDPTNGGGTTDPSTDPTNGGGTTDPSTDPTNGGGTTDPSTDPSNGDSDPSTGGDSDPDDGDTDPSNDPATGNTDPDDGDNQDPVNTVCSDGVIEDKTDSFVQNVAQSAKVDILWVVDDSGSMGDEQEALAKNFDVFINDFITRGIDFKMAITSTSVSKTDSLDLASFDKLTTAAAAANKEQFLNDFKSMIKVGVKGSPYEKGIQTSTDFLKKFTTWQREEAYLVIVYISDEQDQSDKSVASYHQELLSYKTQNDHVKAYSIVTQQIDPNKQWETVGTRYMELSTLTQGPVANIHADFHQTLKDFGGSILNLLDSFQLGDKPLESKIEISVEGQVKEEGWNYNDQSNTVSFEQDHIPSEGADIEASYQVCRQ